RTNGPNNAPKTAAQNDAREPPARLTNRPLAATSMTKLTAVNSTIVTQNPHPKKPSPINHSNTRKPSNTNGVDGMTGTNKPTKLNKKQAHTTSHKTHSMSIPPRKK